MMPDLTDSALDIYVTGLRNQHAVENQAIELLMRQVERLENYPDMADRIRQHITESQQQAHRLEELLTRFNTSHSVLKDSMASFMGNMAAMAHTVTRDEVVKNTFANYAFEHFEIAAYKSLLGLTDLVDQPGARTALEQSLREEMAMAQWIDQRIAATTRRYVELRAQGITAGV